MALISLCVYVTWILKSWTDFYCILVLNACVFIFRLDLQQDKKTED